MNARLPWLLTIGAAVGLLLGVDAAAAQVADATQTTPFRSTDRFADIVAEAAQRFGVSSVWIRAVIRIESAGEVRAVSAKGAMGLMQLMPDTWSYIRSRYGLGVDPFDAHDNIFAGAAYLRELFDRYGTVGFLAAYNAGPARYEAHLATGQPLPDETRRYVAMIAPLIGGSSHAEPNSVTRPASVWTGSSLFVGPSRVALQTPQASTNRRGAQPGDDPLSAWTALTPPSDGLFVRTATSISRP